MSARDEEIRNDMMRSLKGEVKQIMEEAVTRKHINYESTSVTTLCLAVERCLLHGLRRRVVGLFGSASTFGLLHKLAKYSDEAKLIITKVFHLQQQSSIDRRSSLSDIMPDQWLNSSGYFRGSSQSSTTTPTGGGGTNDKLVAQKYLWIRIALFHKTLATVVEHIVTNASKFYEKEALVMDPVCGSMIASLLVGPCAIEYSKMKTQDHAWTDPSADELMLRHKLQSHSSLRSGTTSINSNSMSPKSPRRGLHAQRTVSSGVTMMDDSQIKISSDAREYVQSLHQNFKSTLLYGKNNVTVHPNACTHPVRGYLSLHQTCNASLSIRWTPNHLMHTNSDPTESEIDKGLYWKYALNVNVEDVVYLHCHHNVGQSSGSIVLVGADGIQHPPIVFPQGQHPVQFLACLENGLLPWGRLDPPLWLQKGKGKVLPRLKRKSSIIVSDCSSSMASSVDDITSSHHDVIIGDSGLVKPSTLPTKEREPLSDDDAITDFVFRIIPSVQAAQLQSSTVEHQSSSCNSFTVIPPLSTANSSNARRPVPNSRLVTLAKLSSGLRDRFISLGSTDRSPSPSTTNKSISLTSEIVEEEEVVNGHYDIDQPVKPAQVGQKNRMTGEWSPFMHRHSEPANMGQQQQQSNVSPSRKCLQSACDSMRHQILGRAFYGWLAHCRHLRTVRTHLSGLIEPYGDGMPSLNIDTTPSVLAFTTSDQGVDEAVWDQILNIEDKNLAEFEMLRAVYLHGIKSKFAQSPGVSIADSKSLRATVWPFLLGFYSLDETEEEKNDKLTKLQRQYEATICDWTAVQAIVNQRDKEAFQAARLKSSATSETSPLPLVTKMSSNSDVFSDDCSSFNKLDEQSDSSDADEGTNYSKSLIDSFGLNLHRIDKDVQRCDRNQQFYSSQHNLDRLRTIMCTFVYDNLSTGYVQGMCDLAAPLLIVFDDEVLSYGCFVELMKRMSLNFPFPHGGAMDTCLANMRSLLQVIDPELFDLMHQNGDYTHFYFCYRWFLLDFKRELKYCDIFAVWEVIWSARRLLCDNFALFVALALVETYRDVILDNNMDFTDIIKFFNEMAEKHDAKETLRLSRHCLANLQTLIHNSLTN